MVGLVRCAPTLDEAVDVGEEAWRAVSQSAPLLLFTESHGFQEAEIAHQVALDLAYRFARDGFHGVGAGIAFALDGRPAESVLRWVQRGHAPLRRPLEARIAKPPEVPLSDWASWSAAVSTRQPMELVPPLRVIRKSAPDFLST